MINVLFFASLKEQLKTTSLELSVNENESVEQLLENLQSRDTIWQKALSSNSLMIAVNQTMTDKSTLLKSGDEIAFFPPVTGG